MAWFRISKVNIIDESKIAPILDEVRESVSAISSDFIEMARAEDGSLTVIARYPDKAAMEAATATATNAFKRFFEEGASDPASLDIWTGEVTHTF